MKCQVGDWIVGNFIAYQSDFQKYQINALILALWEDQDLGLFLVPPQFSWYSNPWKEFTNYGIIRESYLKNYPSYFKYQFGNIKNYLSIIKGLAGE